MYELPGVAVEFGFDRLLREVLREHITQVDTIGAFEQSEAECYPETVKIGWIEYDTATAIKELDPVSWENAHCEWIDSKGPTENWSLSITVQITIGSSILSDSSRHLK